MFKYSLWVTTSSLISQMLHVPTSHAKNGNRTQSAGGTEMVVSEKDRTWTWTLVWRLNALTSFVQFKLDNNENNFGKWIYNWNALWKILMLAKKETRGNLITLQQNCHCFTEQNLGLMVWFHVIIMASRVFFEQHPLHPVLYATAQW